MHAAAITDQAWDTAVLASAQAVVVGICTPASSLCHDFAAIVDTLAVELEGTARVLAINLDENPAVARRYDISSLPTLLVFRDGLLVGRLIGARSKERLLRELSHYL